MAISRADLAAEIERVQFARTAPPVKRAAQRRFDGAKVDRLTASWQATNVAIDFELRTDLDRLRARSRDMVKNNEYASKFMRMVRNNVVGPEGFTLQCRAADPNGAADAVANKAIETAFDTWSRPGNCEVTGRLSFADVCRTQIVALARDGEILFKRVRGRGPFGYQLQVLDVARIDTHYNVAGTKNSNAIIMGVEVDQYRAPVAYHLWTAAQLPGDYTRTRERIPAAEIIHAFIPLETEQARGVPWMHAGMRRCNDLNGYREAAVIAARVGASKMGFFHSPDGQPPSADGKDDEGNFITQASPGEFGVIPNGYDFTPFDPTYPHEQFEAFCKGTLRGIASAWGLAYNGLANDLEGVNFSSIRAGVLEERDEWLVVQNWFVAAVLLPIFEDWLGAALLMNAITLPNGKPLPPEKLQKFSAHVWQGRRWQWVDPLKDVEAAVTAINNGLTSPQQIAAQTGRDVEDVLDELARFQAMVKEKSVELIRGALPKSGTGGAGDGGSAPAPAGE
jgi:lambda family phage portal protein